MAKPYEDFCCLCDSISPNVCQECEFNPGLMVCPSNYIPRDGKTWNERTEKTNEFDTVPYLGDNYDWVPYKDVKKPSKKEADFDPVSHPSHYTEGRQYEPRKVIHDWGLNFNLGNAVKYISRAGRKGDALEDLKKARQYLDFEIEEMEKEDK